MCRRDSGSFVWRLGGQPCNEGGAHGARTPSATQGNQGRHDQQGNNEAAAAKHTCTKSEGQIHVGVGVEGYLDINSDVAARLVLQAAERQCTCTAGATLLAYTQ